MPRVNRKETYLLISEYVLEGKGPLGNFSRDKGVGKCHFPPLSPSLDTQISAKITAVPTLFT